VRKRYTHTHTHTRTHTRSSGFYEARKRNKKRRAGSRAFFRRRSRGYRALRIDRLILLSLNSIRLVRRGRAVRVRLAGDPAESSPGKGEGARAPNYELPARITPVTGKSSVSARGKGANGNRDDRPVASIIPRDQLYGFSREHTLQTRLVAISGECEGLRVSRVWRT